MLQVILIFPSMVTFSFKTKIMLQFMLPGQYAFFTRFIGNGITDVHIISLSCAFGLPYDTAHLAGPIDRLIGSCIGTAHPGAPSVFRFKNKLHGIFILKPSLFTIRTQLTLAHDLFDMWK